MKSKKSGDHKLAVEVLKIEGGVKQVNIGQCKELLAKLKMVLASDTSLRVDFLNSLYTEVANFEVEEAVIKARK